MKLTAVTIVTITLIAALAAFCLPTGAAEPHMNGIDVSPSFAISGDNVTISALGPANKYAALTVLSPSGESVMESYVMLDSLGTGKYVWTVPIDLASGQYDVRARFPGNITDRVLLQIVYDEDVEQTVRLDELEDRLAWAQRENRELASEIVRINQARATDTMLVAVGSGVAVLCLVYMVVKYRERWEWLAAKDHRRGWRTKLARTLLHPNVPDMVGTQIGYVGPNMRKAKADRKAAREGTVNVAPSVVLPGKGGLEVLTVDVPEEVVPKNEEPRRSLLGRFARRFAR
jgi:hypothetical protein